MAKVRWQLAQQLEWRWWRRYLRRRSLPDYLSQKRAYWQRTFAALRISFRPAERVLDAGCGPAGAFIYLHDTQRLTALDPLLERYASLPIFDPADYPTVRFVPAPLETHGLRPPFDTICCFNAVNHVRDWSASLDALTELAAPHTRLLLSSDVHRYGWLNRLFRWLPGDALHPQQHGPEEYRRALRGRGWRIEREVLLRGGRIFDYRAWVCVRS